MAGVLACYFAVWSLYAAIAKSSQDIHTDMGEFVAWSREAGLGTPKHPPLGAWLLRAWFGVFPREDWAYYCFAIALPTLALWITWRLAARYLPPDKRVVGIVLLTFVPFYNFHAIKFNANTVLTPFWALATWWFLRSFETRRVGWAVLAGIAAAAAMLAKYWSVTLLAGLGLAALTRSAPQRLFQFAGALCDARRRHGPADTEYPLAYGARFHAVLLCDGSAFGDRGIRAVFGARLHHQWPDLCRGGHRPRRPRGAAQQRRDPRHAVAGRAGAPHAGHRIRRAVFVRRADRGGADGCHRIRSGSRRR